MSLTVCFVLYGESKLFDSLLCKFALSHKIYMQTGFISLRTMKSKQTEDIILLSLS